MRLPPVRVIASGSPPASVSRWCFEPARARSTGDGPVWSPPKVTEVGGGPGPVDLTGAVELLEDRLVQLLPDPRLLPLAQSPPAGHPRAVAELGRQVSPGDPGVQDEEDPVQRRPVVEALAAGIAIAALDHGQQAAPAQPKGRRLRQSAMTPPTPPRVDHSAGGVRYLVCGILFLKQVLSSACARASTRTASKAISSSAVGSGPGTRAARISAGVRLREY